METDCIALLHSLFPEAEMIGCTTGGEISGTSVMDDQLVATLVSFDSSWVRGGVVSILDYRNSEDAAKALMEQIPIKGLRHIFVLADGVLTNGSEVVRGLNANLPINIPVTGGLAGDGTDFNQSFTIYNGKVESSTITAVGFYGDKLSIGYGSSGGWLPFGPERLITSSVGNTMFELDGKSALDLYKEYLGKHADNLPASGLLFPLSIVTDQDTEAVVRTIKSVDEDQHSLSFAGDVPKGSYARLMRAMPDELIDGAEEAAIRTRKGCDSPDLCILISCVGRKEVLKQLTEEETEIVHEQFGSTPQMAGFYSYGEIAPFKEGHKAILHNQTMTITAFTENEDA